MVCLDRAAFPLYHHLGKNDQAGCRLRLGIDAVAFFYSPRWSASRLGLNQRLLTRDLFLAFKLLVTIHVSWMVIRKFLGKAFLVNTLVQANLLIPSRLHRIEAFLDHDTAPESVDIDELRHLCAVGTIPDHPPFLRPRIWHLLLGSLPPEKSKWKCSRQQSRQRYLVRRQ